MDLSTYRQVWVAGLQDQQKGRVRTRFGGSDRSQALARSEICPAGNSNLASSHTDGNQVRGLVFRRRPSVAGHSEHNSPRGGVMDLGNNLQVPAGAPYQSSL